MICKYQPAAAALPEIAIREVRPVDIDGLVDLLRETGLSEWYSSKKRSQKRELAVAECDGAIIGFMSCDVTHNETTIVALIIRPSHRRKGVGSRLLSPLTAACFANGMKLTTTIEKTNQGAKLFLEARGFRVTKTEEAAYRMEWRVEAILDALDGGEFSDNQVERILKKARLLERLAAAEQTIQTIRELVNGTLELPLTDLEQLKMEIMLHCVAYEKAGTEERH